MKTLNVYSNGKLLLSSKIEKVTCDSIRNEVDTIAGNTNYEIHLCNGKQEGTIIDDDGCTYDLEIIW